MAANWSVSFIIVNWNLPYPHFWTVQEGPTRQVILVYTSGPFKKGPQGKSLMVKEWTEFAKILRGEDPPK